MCVCDIYLSYISLLGTAVTNYFSPNTLQLQLEGWLLLHMFQYDIYFENRWPTIGTADCNFRSFQLLLAFLSDDGCTGFSH